jgi:hypothetical protein
VPRHFVALVEFPELKAIPNQRHEHGAPLASVPVGGCAMNKHILFMVVTAVIILLMVAVRAAGTDVEQVAYDLSAEQVFVGTVHEKPSAFEGRMYFTLFTAKGLITVELGPKEFVTQSGFNLEARQVVTVIGMPVVINNREVILAREITVTGSVFKMRDQNGRRLREMDRTIEMDPEIGAAGIPVC